MRIPIFVLVFLAFISFSQEYCKVQVNPEEKRIICYENTSLLVFCTYICDSAFITKQPEIIVYSDKDHSLPFPIPDTDCTSLSLVSNFSKKIEFGYKSKCSVKVVPALNNTSLGVRVSDSEGQYTTLITEVLIILRKDINSYTTDLCSFSMVDSMNGVLNETDTIQCKANCKYHIISLLVPQTDYQSCQDSLQCIPGSSSNCDVTCRLKYTLQLNNTYLKCVAGVDHGPNGTIDESENKTKVLVQATLKPVTDLKRLKKNITHMTFSWAPPPVLEGLPLNYNLQISSKSQACSTKELHENLHKSTFTVLMDCLDSCSVLQVSVTPQVLSLIGSESVLEFSFPPEDFLIRNNVNLTKRLVPTSSITGLEINGLNEHNGKFSQNFKLLLSIEFKNWINNEQRRAKLLNQQRPVSQTDVVTISKGVKKRSGFQTFCHSQAGQAGSVSSLSEKWKELPQVSKNEWQEKGKDLTKCCTKKTAVKELVSSINSNLSNLSKLGIEGFAIALNLETSECKVMTSSDEVQPFVTSEETEEKFFKYMCGLNYPSLPRKRKKALSYDEMLGVVRNKLKEQYKAKTGKGRIPYSSLNDLGCIVMGMPAGLDFKQPSLYNSCELRTIYNNIDSIEFVSHSDVGQSVVETIELGHTQASQPTIVDDSTNTDDVDE